MLTKKVNRINPLLAKISARLRNRRLSRRAMCEVTTQKRQAANFGFPYTENGLIIFQLFFTPLTEKGIKSPL